MSRMHWHPITGEMQVFGDDETEPEGWLDTHPENPRLGGSVPGREPEKAMTREEIIAALNAGQIQFKVSTSATELQKQLRVALLAALEQHNIPDVEKLTTRQLLAEVEKR